MSRWGEGRKSKGADALSEQVYARVTLAQLAAYGRLGGAAWLRAQIDAAVAADRDLPTAHQPFPTGPDRFTQNQCRITFPPFGQD